MSVGLNLSVAQTNDALGVFEQAGIVRGEDEGEAESTIEAMHEIDELSCVVSVEVSGWLVG